MSEDILREDWKGHVVVTLNRPRKLNAVTREVRDALEQVAHDLTDRCHEAVLHRGGGSEGTRNRRFEQSGQCGLIPAAGLWAAVSPAVQAEWIGQKAGADRDPRAMPRD
jgi:hypothetical protein